MKKSAQIKPRSPKTWVLRIRSVDARIFNALRNGKKRIETRALGSPRASRNYRNIVAGDTLLFICGKRRLRRTVLAVHRYRSPKALFRVYRYKSIDPWARTLTEAIARYDSFPGYTERIKKYGIICFGLK